jgi:UrcA family protein
MTKLLRTIILPALLLAVSAPAIAKGSAEAGTDITAMGRTELRHDWLNLSGPNAQGTVVARVQTSDLDLSSSAGQAERARRVSHASDDLCRATLADPEFPGTQIAAERSCLRAVRSQANRQSQTLLQAAR